MMKSVMYHVKMEMRDDFHLLVSHDVNSKMLPVSIPLKKSHFDSITPKEKM